MFQTVNDVAAKFVSEAARLGRKLVASEVYSLLPVEAPDELAMLEAQLRVVRSGLRLRPSQNKKLESSLDDVFHEIAVAERAAWRE